MVISAGGLSALPADADPQQLAMLAINPRPRRFYSASMPTCRRGEWVVQNAANSGVGRWVIALRETAWPGRPSTSSGAPNLWPSFEARSAETSLSSTLRMSRTGSKRPSVRRSSALALDGRQWPADGRAGSDAFASWHPRQLCSHERESDVHQPARRYLQASHDARLLAGPPGNCRQNWPSSRAGGGDDRLRPAADTSGRDLPYVLDQTGCRACATGRKNPSGRCRIIYLTSESSIRYGHYNQDQRLRSNGRCRLSCPSVRDEDRPLGELRRKLPRL